MKTKKCTCQELQKNHEMCPICDEQDYQKFHDKMNAGFDNVKIESTVKIINRQFDIDWEKIQTLDDIKSLLKGLQMHVYLKSETIPDHLKECFEKDFLIERKS